MITIFIDLLTGESSTETAPTIKPKEIPIKVVFSTSPGDGAVAHFALGSQESSAILAYCDLVADDDGVTFNGLLNANDTRLTDELGSNLVIAVNGEISWEVGEDEYAAPNITVSVQQLVSGGPVSSVGGPTYYTKDQVDALVSGVADPAYPAASDLYTKAQVNSLVSSIAPVYKYVSDNYTAIANDAIQADTSVHTFNITLPSTPYFGDRIIIEDAKLSWGTNPLIINSSKPINGITGSYTADVLGGKLSATYITTGYGWSVK